MESVLISAEEEADESMAEEDILSSIERKLKIHQLSRKSRGETCIIYKVPHKNKEEYPEAFLPQIVSIGPFHHDNTKLLPMEGIKWQFLYNLIGRHESNSLEKYINAVSDPSFVQQITKCYSEQVMTVYCQDTFVEIMVLDGCFIIELLVKFFLREPMGEIDLDFPNWNFELVKNDLLLIENQIPFSILQVLFNSSFVPGLHDSNLPFSITDLCECFMSFDGYDRPAPAPNGNHGSLYRHRHFYPSPRVIHQCLHLRHFRLRPTQSSSVPLSEPRPAWFDGSRVPRTTVTATELLKAGIRFRPNKSAGSILDVTFGVTDGVMKIPVLTVKTTSMSQFRNLIALEQYRPDIGSQVTSFVLFMNCLINTPADVTTLVKSGVLENKLGSEEEVVRFFNTLAKAAYVNYHHDYLGELYKDVKYYCAKEINQ